MKRKTGLTPTEWGSTTTSWKTVPNTKKACGDLKKDIQRLCNLGVLKWRADSKWALPTFIIPKSQIHMGCQQFQGNNKQIVRKPFLLAKISPGLQELEGVTYATALDLNMGYYTIRLDPDASKICSIILPGESTLTSGYQWVLHVLPTSSKLRCLS